MKKLTVWILTLLTATFAVNATAQQAYPSKPVRIVIPFAAGTGIDVIARIVTEEMRKRTGVVTVIDYKPGALGVLGTEQVAKSAPDGYTLMPSSSAVHSSGPQLVKSVPYDTIKDFTHISNLIKLDVVLVVKASSEIRRTEDLIAFGQRDPKALTYGYGSATSQTVMSALLKSMNIEALGVPYKGQPLAINDLLGDQVKMVAVDIGAVLPHIRSGKLRALGIASERRSGLLPELPTFTEQGVKVNLPGWVGIAGPAGLPREVVTWWEKNLAIALASPEVVQRLRAAGFEPNPMTGPAFQKYVQEQFVTWGQAIRNAGITPE